MIGSTNFALTFDPSILAFGNLHRKSIFADVAGLEGVAMDLVNDALFGSSNFADDDFDVVKRNRRSSYNCRGGRFGGDVGNRKRREGERHDNDIEHAQRLQAEHRQTRLAIEDGLAEYYGWDKPRGKRSVNRGGAPRSRMSGFGRRIRDDRPVATTSGGGNVAERSSDDRTKVVEQGRTGHLVAVTVLPKNCTRLQRKKALASIARRLPRLSTVELKAKMGLA